MPGLAEIHAELEEWIKNKPIWQQHAAMLLLTKEEFGNEEFSSVLQICEAEYGLRDPTILVQAMEFRDGILTQPGAHAKFSLTTIENPKGVGRLAPNSPLEFSHDGLNVIYGSNGSGKSGYVRLIKHAAGVKNLGTLHSDAFSNEKATQSCKFKLVANGILNEIDWLVESGPAQALQGTDVFDEQYGKVFLVENHEPSYEPRALLFLTTLTDLVDKIAEAFRSRRTSLKSPLPALPNNYGHTSRGRWYNGLRAEIEQSEVERNCVWPDEFELRLTELRAKFNVGDLSAQQQSLLRARRHLHNLQTQLSALVELSGLQSCDRFIKLRNEAINKRRAATDAANVVFSGSTLGGIGSESWRLLWEAARAYSSQEAYPNVRFPKVDDGTVCVLCQQPLETAARERFQKFEDYVTSSLQRSAEESEKELERSAKKVMDFVAEFDVESEIRHYLVDTGHPVC